MDKLAMIPSGKKVSKLYSVLPDDGSGDFTVVSDQKYVINESGILELVPVNTPAFDYSDGSGCPALLVEFVSTNLLTYSEDFSNASWSKGRVTVDTNIEISPNNTLSSDKISDVVTVANDTYALTQSINFVSGNSYTESFFAKNIDRRYCYVRFVSTAFTSNKYAMFDLQDGIITREDSGVTATMTLSANGFYKCTATATATFSVSSSMYIGLSNNGVDNVYINPSIKSIYLWGAELKEIEGSYIKTEGTTVTRAADIETVTTPAGVTSITETIGGVEQTPITVIPATYQIPNGLINKITMI